MLMRNVMKRNQRGFTLIEAMISAAVLSFGLLAVGTFQAKLVKESAFNKARFEALALAQKKLDDIRSYSSEHGMVEKLINTPVADPAVGEEYVYPNDVPTAATPYEDDTTITGKNATFTRGWTVSRAVTTPTTDNDSLLSNIVVAVSWSDRSGNHSVSLQSDVTWRNPRGSADVEEITTPLVAAPTGKAYLGDGTLTKDEMDAIKADPTKFKGKNNNDGTWQADHDLDGDLELIVEKDDDSGEAEVVLTLPDACKVAGGCSDFVTISGSIFFHRKVGNTKFSNLTSDEVWVIASDAAYCSRWIPDPTATIPTTGDLTGPLPTSRDLTTLPTSGAEIYRRNDDQVKDFNGIGGDNYDYYNYTCYLGGGWYGNIGVVLLKSTTQDFACVGDPLASTTSAGDKWRRVEVAKRRVYRGMLHKYDSNHDPITATKIDELGNTITYIPYYSQGIKDASSFPADYPVKLSGLTYGNWTDRDYGHDFVISNASKPSIEDCKVAMTAPDTNPDAADELTTGNLTDNLFHHVSGDWICLNDDWENAPAGEWVNFEGYPWHYLNTFDTDVYDARTDCPYDPSVPPSMQYTFNGTITLESANDATWGSFDPLLNATVDGNINTSDGFENCRILSVGVTTISYECDYYVWSDIENVELPWKNGAVTVSTPDDIVCAPDDGVTDLTDPSSYTWTAVFDGLIGSYGSLNVTPNFVCKDVTEYTIKGDITVQEGNDLTQETFDIRAYDSSNAELGDVEVGVCSIDYAAIDGYTPQKVSYTCTGLLEPTYLGGFIGKVKLSIPTAEGYSCTSLGTLDGDVATSSCTMGIDGVQVVWNFPLLKAPTVSTGSSVSNSNNIALTGPITKHNGEIEGFYGIVVNNTGIKFDSAWFDNDSTIPDFMIELAYDGGLYPPGSNCRWFAVDPAGKDATYTCTIYTDSRVSPDWQGELIVRPLVDSGFWCGTDTAWSIDYMTGYAPLPTVTCNEVAVLPPGGDLVIDGTVLVGFATDTLYENWKGLPTDGIDIPSPDILVELKDALGNPAGDCGLMPITPLPFDPVPTEHNFTCTVSVDSVTGTWSGFVEYSLVPGPQPWAELCPPSSIAILESPAGLYDPAAVGGELVWAHVSEPVEFCGIPPAPAGDMLVIQGLLDVMWPSDTAFETVMNACPTCGNDIVTSPIYVELWDEFDQPIAAACSPVPITPALTDEPGIKHSFTCEIAVDAVTGMWGGSVHFGLDTPTYWANLCTATNIIIPPSPAGPYDFLAVGGEPVEAFIDVCP